MKGSSNELVIFITDASDSRKCQHLYLRGNYQQDMFYDKVDKINVWNRLWLSAKATGTQILSVKILNNHLHISALFESDSQRAQFKHHFRLSITQYHNQRYNIHGTLGTRTFKHGTIRGTDDLKDCVCYHCRNILHHGINRNYLDYSFSTVRCVFGLELESQKGIYTRDNLPENLAKAYLPARERLPENWQMTREGLIVPPPEIFRADIIEALFNSREEYLEALSRRTSREMEDKDEPCASSQSNSLTLDEQIADFVRHNSRLPIASMNASQKMEAIRLIVNKLPNVNIKLLSRLFGIPYNTLRYRLKKLSLTRVTRVSTK